MIRVIKNEKGLSLLEIVLSAAIMGLVAGPLFSGLNQGLAGILSAGRETVATELAAASMEKLKSVWEDTYEINLPAREEIVSEDYPGFILIQEAYEEEAWEQDGLRRNLVRVTVSVKYQEQDKESQIRLESLLVGRR